MSDLMFPENHIFAGVLAINANKSISTQTTLPDSVHEVGQEYLRETPPQIIYNINYKCVNMVFVNTLLDAIKTPNEYFTAYYYYSDDNEISQETSQITGLLQSFSAQQIEGTKYFSAQVTIKDNSFIARIGD